MLGNLGSEEYIASAAWTGQSVRTGASPGGYTLSSVDLAVDDVTAGGSTDRPMSVKIRENNENNRPGELVATLTNPATLTSFSLNTFTAPAGTTLNADTTYWIMVNDGHTSLGAKYATTLANSETGRPGWSIGNGRLWRFRDDPTWINTWNSLIFALKGTPVQTSVLTEAQGKPAVSGSPQVGQPLTATPGDMEDANGLPATAFPTGYTFQWVRVDDSDNETDIAANAASQTYTPAAADMGYRIKVKVSFTDGVGTVETLASDATQPVAGAKTACPTDAEWCTEMTSGYYPWLVPRVWLHEYVGFNPRIGGPSRGTLDDEDFTYAGTDYTVTRVEGDRYTPFRSGVQSHHLTFEVSGGRLPKGTVLTLNGMEFRFTHGGRETWGNVQDRGIAIDWLKDTKVTTSLNFPPTLLSAVVDGASLVLTYHEDLDTGSTPAASAYEVCVDGGLPTAPSSVSVSGRTVTLTLDSAVGSGETVTVSYTPPASDPVQDESGIDAPEIAKAIDGPASTALTAQFKNGPGTHDGQSRFTVDIVFNEIPHEMGNRAILAALEVSGGTKVKMRRVQKDKAHRRVTIEPDGDGAVTLTLQAERPTARTRTRCAPSTAASSSGNTRSISRARRPRCSPEASRRPRSPPGSPIRRRSTRASNAWTCTSSSARRPKGAGRRSPRRRA